MKKICEFLDCKEEGVYPAPRSREDITIALYILNKKFIFMQINFNCSKHSNTGIQLIPL